MGEQEFYSQTKYTSTKENIAFGLSISCICLLTVIFFGQFNDFLLRLSEAAALAAAITALNIHLLNKLPASYSFKNLPQRVVAHSAIVFTLGALASVITAYMAAGLMGLSFYEVLKFTLATAFMAGLINAAFSLLYFIRLWHKSILHAEELKSEIMHTQLESIRQQLS
ncbi:MAG: hypothetical protein ACXWEY_16385, partial [Bacteroidia bacterium]